MAWRAITEDDVKGSGLTGPELTAARTTANPSGVTDRLSEIIANVTTEVRGYAGRRNPLGEGATIPDECILAALARIVFELALKIPGKILLSDQRDKANSNAIRFLERVAAGDVVIVPPTDHAASQPSQPRAEVVSVPPRRTSRDQLAGL